MALHPAEYHNAMLQLLDDNNTRIFHIEYGGFLVNHLSHGLHALYKLNAPIDRAKAYLNWHKDNKLESSKPYRDREQSETSSETCIEDLIGSRKSFYRIFDHYEHLLEAKYGQSVDSLIAGEFPTLSRGLGAAVFHGLIHLGYGYDSGRRWFVCEGLAYLHYANDRLMITPSPPTLDSFGQGNMHILDVLNEVRNDRELLDSMNKSIKKDKWAEMHTSEILRKSMVLLTEYADQLVTYANKVQIPNIQDPNNGLFSSEVQSISKWLVDSAVTVYAIAEFINDFVLLHGVTGAWSLKNILPLLTGEQIRDALRTFLCVLFAAYMASGCPRLETETLRERTASYSWEEIIQRLMEHEQYHEEHLYKLVQVCHDMDEENRDKEMSQMYKLAAHTCVTQPLSYLGKQVVFS